MTRTTSTASLGRAVGAGAGGGVTASLVMAMYAMVAAWEKGTGFFTRSTTSPPSGHPATP